MASGRVNERNQVTTKTIIVSNNKQIHLDPLGANVELSIKVLNDYVTTDHCGCEKPRLTELERVVLDRQQRLELAAALLGDDLNAIVKGLALELVKEAA